LTVSHKVWILAPAKVNLTLEVLGRRADGYHELASLMATVDLHDDVRVGPARALDVRIRPPVYAAPGQDLASRAVRAMAGACGRDPTVHVTIRKRIPVAAGLGGGSSDAGAVLRALVELWGVADVDPVRIAADVGSDVAFFAAGHALARVGGRGERVAPLAAPSDPLWISLAVLPARSATSDVFAAHQASRSDGRATEELARLFASGAATPATVREIARNDLTNAAEHVCPLVAEARATARRHGIELVVSGSGPSLFAIADDRAHAIRMSRALRRAGIRARPHVIATSTGRTRPLPE
jgi:4-diphosphocytidyl-2-C-methyl-D-erythritol kinase